MNTTMELLIGLKVVAIKGDISKHSDFEIANPEDLIEVKYILFDDGKTFIQFNEQDKYDYHDCCSSARTIGVYQVKELYEKLMKLPDATLDI